MPTQVSISTLHTMLVTFGSRSSLSNIQVITFVMCAILGSRLCLAKEILILTPVQNEIEHHALQVSIDSQMMDYDISSELYILDSPVPDTLEPLQVAKHYQALTGKFVVFWLNNHTFFLYIHDTENNRFYSRPLPTESTNWELQCDAIASVVHAVVSTWLNTPDVAPQKANKILQSADSPKTASPPTISSEKSPVSAPPTDAKSDPLSLGVGAIYTGFFMSTDTPWVSGAGTSVLLVISPHFLVGLEPGFALKTVSSFRLLRIPIRAHITAFVKKNRMRVGAELSLMMDSTRITSRDGSRLSQADTIYWGVGAGATYSYYLHKKIALFSRVGLDVLSKSNVYWFDNQPIFYYGPVQGRISFGIIFWR